MFCISSIKGIFMLISDTYALKLILCLNAATCVSQGLGIVYDGFRFLMEA